MSRRHYKRDFSSFFLFVFIMLMIGGLVYTYMIYKNIGISEITDMFTIEKKDKEEKEIINYEITDDYESDKDVIEKVFMSGMDTEDYKKLFEQKTNYIEKNDKYKKIDYNFDKKLHYSELESIYKNMNNSDIANVEIIGKSVDNRNMYGIEIGKGDRVLFMDANIHAAEVSTTLILTKFLSDILNDYDNGDKTIVDLLNNVKIAVIPCMNPDGYEVYNYGIESLNNKDLWLYKNRKSISFEYSKSNANGVDLNRNFPTQHEGMYYKGNNLISNTSLELTTSKSKYFNGYSGGSEPETKASMYFMLKHYKNTYAYINVHSQGRVLYAGKPNLSKEFNDLTQSFAKKVSKINGYTVHGLSSEEVGEGNDGSATDFMAELANGFIFSTKTGRLSSDKYKNNSCELKYKYPVITMEITRTWTSDPSIFKTEYYDYGLKKLFYKLIEENF